MEEMEKDTPFVIQNEKPKQEVLSASGETAGFVFYEPGKSAAFGGVEVDKSCVAMLKKTTEGLQVSVADPTQLLSEITMVLNGEFSGENVMTESGKTFLNFLLPGGGEAGKTITVQLVKK
jgi:hypothetical protein